MQYLSIGDVSARTGISISTLRYYDREGLFPQMERSSGGIRQFSDAEIGLIQMIQCLKNSGMPIKEIKQFLDWCKLGASTLPLRRDMFYDRREVVTQQMEALQKTLNFIQYKCWYYDTALAAGSEDAPKRMPDSEIPDEIRKYRADND